MAIEVSTSVVAHAVRTAAPVTPVAVDPAAVVPAAADPAQVARFRAHLDSATPVSGADMSAAASRPGAVSAPAASVSPDGSVISPASAPGDLAPESADAVANGSRTAGPVSLGDAILKGLDHLRNHMQEGWSAAMAPLEPENGQLSTAGLLQLQTGVLQMSFESQMVGTIAGKTSQSIDQLVKMQ